MASSLSAQLSQIAATSTNQLDLKAQKAAHSQSLIFDKQTAKSQDFNTLYLLCYDGFKELCLLDSRFTEFGRSIFSEQSKSEDRTEMTSDQNKQLDNVVEAFLGLVGARLLLSPAVKAVEWLVRRFRVHEYNTSFLILTFLPYHTTPLFLNLLSILPEDITPSFKVLYPYKRSLLNPPRHPIVHSATTNKSFCAALNNYILQVSRAQSHYSALFSFWIGIMAEAISGMLDAARNGKRDVERRNQEDVLLRILPVLNEGFAVKGVPDLTIGCFMISTVLANKASLQDQVMDGLMETVATSWTEDTLSHGISCLSQLMEQKGNLDLPNKVIKSVIHLNDALGIMKKLSERYSMSKLLLGLVSGCLRNLHAQKKPTRLEFVGNLIERGILGEEQTLTALEMFLRAADSLHQESGGTLEIKRQLSDIIERFNESDSLRPILQKAIQSSNIDVASLEITLQSVIEAETPKAIEDVQMEDAQPETPDEEFIRAIESLPSQTNEISYLSEESSHTFSMLSQAFLLAVGSQGNLDRFRDLPILKRSMATRDPLYLSFFVRIFSGSFPANAKAAALDETSSYLSKNADAYGDMQVLLPFLIVTLNDPSEKVRRKAVALLTMVDRLLSKGKSDDGSSKQKPWGHNSIYGSGEQSKLLNWLSPRDAYKVVHRTILPGLEEYILDADQVGIILHNTLRGSSSSDSADMKDAKSPGSELKKSLRLALFAFLCSHAINCPVYAVKLRFLGILNRVDRVSSVSRTKQLLPLLQAWENLSERRVAQICGTEGIVLAAAEQQICDIITPKDKEALDSVISTVLSAAGYRRPSFLEAIFHRLREIWPSIKEDRQISTAEKLLQISTDTSAGDEALASYCRDLLRNVDLSGAILVKFIRKIPDSITDIEESAPPPKRRRTSQNDMVAMNMRSPEDMDLIVQKMTFILELVDGSDPENHPELTQGLFQTLAALHHFKSQVQSELSYLLTLVLGSLLAIVNKSKGFSQSKLDSKAIRTDLIVDCVRNVESPQVQNTALLLVAGLATVAPELVLHSVMPIFTFMGSNVLIKDDEYSAHVIDQTIDQVVPPLIQSLHDQKRDVVSGTSELLLSFTTAFEHIPSHRRLRLFRALITKLGPEDFLFAVLAMIANRYSSDNDALSLMTGLAGSFDPELQLITYNKYLDLVKESLGEQPTLSRVLLGVGSEDGRDKWDAGVDLLNTLSHLLKDASLDSEMVKNFRSEGTEQTLRIWRQFSDLLENSMLLAEATAGVPPVSQAFGDVISSILGVVSLVDFLDTISILLERPNDDLRRKVLRLLDSRLRRETERNSISQARILDFMSTLTKIIEDSSDILLKHAAVACIDRISEKYGKKDLSKVVAAAKVISGRKCLGQFDDRIRVMGLLCLASMTEVLGQQVTQVLVPILAQSCRLLEKSLEDGKENLRLHDAAFSLISALFEHVPFMILDDDLEKILELSFKSTCLAMPDESNMGRREVLRLMAKGVDAKQSFGAVQRKWSSAVAEGPDACQEALEVVSIAIEKHPQSQIVKNINSLSGIITNAFDLRRTQLCQPTDDSYDEEDVDQVEASVNDVVIKMIYKLNDTTFRPLFASLTEWATSGLPETDSLGRTMRLTTFYKFLDKFFSTLGSVVAGYASYILENAVEVLGQSSPSSKDSKPLWLATLRTLSNAFEHDRDEFWQSPNHLNAISTPLISQLSHATNNSTLDMVVNEAVPAIVELAVAADSPDNHKEMNATIMKFMRPSTDSKSTIGGDSPYARLAAVKCEQSLTERLGEEWLALLPEMLPYISELMEDEDERVEKEVGKWVLAIEEVLGEKLDDMLM
ncbi:snoRNA-binding rRNA-processing protein utp10 [Arachnomyces sp. PD_36]|nr:snoRNA-binding rRNA-processing protein utp10 [Arachnomyces sp. PD_36]